MTRRVTFTRSEIERYTKAARAVDPDAVIEVTPGGTLRILPAKEAKAVPDARSETQRKVDEWFGNAD